MLGAAILIIAALAALSYRTVRVATAAWDRLLDEQVAQLVAAERLAAVSAIGARLTRDALVTGDPLVFRALGANRAETLSILAQSRARSPETERERLDALARDHAFLWRLGGELIDHRMAGAPLEPLLARMQREGLPVRLRIERTLDAHVAFHEEALRAAREQVAISERRGVAALGGTVLAGVALAALLGAVLGRSLAALRASEVRFRATFEQAAVGIAHVDLEGRWLRVNGRYAALLGRSSAELAGRSYAELLHPEDRAEDATQLRRLLAGEVRSYALEVRHLRPRGEPLWVNATCAAVRGRGGRAIYLVRAAEDVSARRRVERDLREAVRVRDEFAKVASHELRTPLATLRLQVESLRAAALRPGADAARLAAKADAALRQAGRLDALVDGVLDASMLAGAELELTTAEADVTDLARAVLDRAAGAARREGVTLRLHADGACWAQVDRHRLEQALAHLVSNALRYGAGQPVDVRVEAAGDRVRITVEDRGIGIDPADVERIFARFERASSWRHYGGLGLGLFLTRRIAEAHGGSVRVEGAPGEGATFTLELPRGGPSADEADAREARGRGGEGPHAHA